MPSPSSLKPTGSSVKTVRKQAGRCLDQAIAALSAQPASADRAAARRALLRLHALLELIRKPLGREVYRREIGVVKAALKHLAEPDDGPRRLLDQLCKQVEDAPIGDALAALHEAVSPDVAGDQITPAAADPGVPDPAVLRAVADLAEARMRCGYWHLPDEGFDLFASGLRATYGRAARSMETTDAPADAAAATRLLAEQVRWLERAWPTQLTPYRKAVKALAEMAERQHAAAVLLPHVEDHPTLQQAVTDASTAAATQVQQERSRVFAETSAAFTRRVAAYWNALNEPGADR